MTTLAPSDVKAFYYTKLQIRWKTLFSQDASVSNTQSIQGICMSPNPYFELRSGRLYVSFPHKSEDNVPVLAPTTIDDYKSLDRGTVTKNFLKKFAFTHCEIV